MNEGVIFSRGATLRDVPPHVRGISREEFLRRDIVQQCSEYLKTQAGRTPEILNKPVATYKKGKAAKERVKEAQASFL